MWLIQGNYFHEKPWLDVEMVPIDGAVAVIREGLTRNMYYGVLHPEPEHCVDASQGSIHDPSGSSFVYDVCVGEQELAFVKIYEHRKDIIRYTFSRKVGNVWVGEYKGKLVGNGITCCVLAEIDPSFFDPMAIAKLLGRETPFTPPS